MHSSTTLLLLSSLFVTPIHAAAAAAAADQESVDRQVLRGTNRRLATPASKISGVTTSPSTNKYLEDIQGAPVTATNVPTLNIDPSQTFQSIDGFGYTLTEGSAQHLMEMNPNRRTRLLHELFGDLKLSVLRIPVGASDLAPDPYSLDDTPGDVNLDHFTMEREMEYKIPLLGEILAINPNVQLMGTPWSAPFWMKDNYYTSGGSLMHSMFDPYANYLVKYLQAMKVEGLPLHSLTIQNEPLNWYNNPSMYMTSYDQGNFIKDHLGPKLKAAGLDTKLILYDHNLDVPEYATDILDNPDIRDFVDGSAFHMYAGTIDVMTQVHNQHPDKAVYFTEQYTAPDGEFEGDLMWHAKHVWIGALNNWSKTVMEWNLSSNPSLTPHTPGGCINCLGAITVDGNNIKQRNIAYYLAAHTAPYIPRDTVRIGSSFSGGDSSHIDHVVLKAPNGNMVIVLANHFWEDNIIIVNGEQVTLPRISVTTLIF